MREGALTDLLQQSATTQGVPGAALGVLQHGRPVTAYVGVADVRTGEPVGHRTLWGIGSLTKSMVASVAMLLAKTGHLSLDDLVSRHVPELRGREWAEQSSLRDLMANRSRVPERSSG